MPRLQNKYSVFSRPSKKKKNKKYYYVKFRNDDGTYRNPISTGHTSRDDAIRWAEARLRGETQAAKAPRPESVCSRVLGPFREICGKPRFPGVPGFKRLS